MRSSKLLATVALALLGSLAVPRSAPAAPPERNASAVEAPDTSAPPPPPPAPAPPPPPESAPAPAPEPAPTPAPQPEPATPAPAAPEPTPAPAPAPVEPMAPAPANEPSVRESPNHGMPTDPGTVGRRIPPPAPPTDPGSGPREIPAPRSEPPPAIFDDGLLPVDLLACFDGPWPFAPMVASAYTPPPAARRSSLVEIEVVVNDGLGRPVAGLTPDSFALSEDGEPVAIVTFAPPGDGPRGEFGAAYVLGFSSTHRAGDARRITVRLTKGGGVIVRTRVRIGGAAPAPIQ